MFYDKVMLNFYSATREKSVSQPRMLGSDFIASVVKTRRCRFLISSSPTILIVNKLTHFKGTHSEDMMGKVGHAEIISSTPKNVNCIKSFGRQTFDYTFSSSTNKASLLYVSISITILVL